MVSKKIKDERIGGPAFEFVGLKQKKKSLKNEVSTDYSTENQMIELG